MLLLTTWLSCNLEYLWEKTAPWATETYHQPHVRKITYKWHKKSNRSLPVFWINLMENNHQTTNQHKVHWHPPPKKCPTPPPHPPNKKKHFSIFGCSISGTNKRWWVALVSYYGEAGVLKRLYLGGFRNGNLPQMPCWKMSCLAKLWCASIENDFQGSLNLG